MNQADQKKAAAAAALEYLPENAILGIGTGSTVQYFIECLSTIKHNISGVIASSEATAKQLKFLGIPILDLNTVSELPIYIDSADAYNTLGQLVKGGGGALTREKILATAAQEFIVIADESKETKQFGEFPIAVEVLPMARSLVARAIVKQQGTPRYREHVITDNGNIILDIHHWPITDPMAQEQWLNSLPGVVENGLFAQRTADRLLIGTAKKGVRSLTP